MLSRVQVLDIRDLADEWESELVDSDELDRPEFMELLRDTQKYRDLCSELGVGETPEDLRSYGDNFDSVLIHENYFKEYAQELADEVGAIDHNASWPMTCIDWEWAARELEMDYSHIEYDGETYLVRQ